jgi:hypothetical protein
MSATKIAASLRVSLTALLPKQAGRRSRWLGHGCTSHAALWTTWKQEVQGPAFRLAKAYPRRIELITHSEGGIDGLNVRPNACQSPG